MSATNQPKSGTIAEPRKPYHHGDLRRAIIASATRRARHSGERAIVLREIAAEIGVSATAAYRHFTNRAELVDIVASRGIEEMAESMRTSLVLDAGVAAESESDRAGLAAWADVRNACRAYVKFAIDEPQWNRMISETGGTSPVVREAADKLIAALRKPAEKGVPSGVFRAEISDTETLEIWSSLLGMSMISALGFIGEGKDVDRIWDVLDAQLQRVIGPILLTEKGQELVAEQKPFPAGALSDLTDWL